MPTGAAERTLKTVGAEVRSCNRLRSLRTARRRVAFRQVPRPAFTRWGCDRGASFAEALARRRPRFEVRREQVARASA